MIIYGICIDNINQLHTLNCIIVDSSKPVELSSVLECGLRINKSNDPDINAQTMLITLCLSSQMTLINSWQLTEFTGVAMNWQCVIGITGSPYNSRLMLGEGVVRAVTEPCMYCPPDCSLCVLMLHIMIII